MSQAVTCTTRGIKSLSKTLFWLCLGVSALAATAPPAHAGDGNEERVQITDPFIELRTGPGRGYPVYFVAAREEWISIELRHTDWYKVRTAGGKVGWVNRSQLVTTLTEAGGAKSFRDIAIDDYLLRRAEFGAAWGRFKTEPMLKLWAGYKMSDTLSLEATVGQVQGVFSGTNFWHVNVQTEPWSDQRFSPFFGIGLGRFRNIPNASLVSAEPSNSNLANGTLGVKYHLTDRFVARLDYTIYTAYLSDSRTGQYRALTAGLSFFF
jgi:Bacterial SH3 domain